MLDFPLSLVSLAVMRVSSGNTTQSSGSIVDPYDTEYILSFRRIHPISDGQGTGKLGVNTWARHKWAHSQFKYQYALTHQGGSFPYTHQIVGTEGVDYPTGFQIVYIYDTLNNVPQAVVEWTPSGEAQSSTWDIEILTTDQEDRLDTLVYTLTLDDDMFRFQDPTVGASPTAAGTWADPYGEFLDWYNGKTSVADTVGKIMVYRGYGATTMHTVQPTPGGTGDDTNRILFYSSTYHPLVHIGVPGEDTHFDTSQATFWNLGVGGNNMYFSDITCNGSLGALEANTRIFGTVGGNQIMFFNMHFENMTRGSVGTSNESCMYFVDPGGYREYVSIINCTSDSLPMSLSGTNGMSLLDIYSCKYVIQTCCSDSNSVGAKSIWYKSGDSHYEVRGNTLRDGTDAATNAGILALGNSWNTAGITAGNYVIRYNNIKHVDGPSGRTFDVNQEKKTPVGPGLVVKNTFVGNTLADFQVGDGDCEWDRNVLISSSGLDPDYVLPSGAVNISASSESGILDANGHLTAQALLDYSVERGVVGSEIVYT